MSSNGTNSTAMGWICRNWPNEIGLSMYSRADRRELITSSSEADFDRSANKCSRSASWLSPFPPAAWKKDGAGSILFSGLGRDKQRSTSISKWYIKLFLYFCIFCYIAILDTFDSGRTIHQRYYIPHFVIRTQPIWCAFPLLAVQHRTNIYISIKFSVFVGGQGRGRHRDERVASRTGKLPGSESIDEMAPLVSTTPSSTPRSRSTDGTNLFESDMPSSCST